MKKQTSNDTVIESRNTEQIARLGDWCRTNLTKEEWDYDVITMFPLWIKFKIHCPKQRILAILSS